MIAIRQLFNSTAAKVFAVITVVIFLTMLTFEMINDRFWLHDLEVMVSAANALLNDQPIYGLPFGLGTGFYKYAPFTLFLFVPYALLPYKVACVLQFVISVLCIVITIPLLEKLVRKHLLNDSKKYILPLFVILAASMIHLVRDLHLGNINMMIVFALTLSFKYLLEGKPIKFSVLLALVIITKPYFIVAVIPLLLHKKYREVSYVAIWGMVFVFCSLLFMGFTKGLSLHLEWFSAMLEHSNYLTSNATLFYILKQYIGIDIGSNYAFPLLAVIALLSSIYFWVAMRSADSQFLKNKALMVHFFMLIAIIPNVFITDTEHFIFSMPLIAVLVVYFSGKSMRLWIPLLLLILFLYGGNSTDLMGNYLNGKYHTWGLLGIGNLLIITTALIVYGRLKQTAGDKLVK